MSNANLFALFQNSYAGKSERPVIIDPDGTVRYSFGDLEEYTARIAALLTELQVGRGDRVVVQVDKSPEMLFLYLACLRKGVIFIPLNTAYTQEEVRYFLSDATPGLLVCDPEKEPALKQVAADVDVAHILTLDSNGTGSLTDAAAVVKPDEAIEEMADEDIAAILYTSGTTGRSKGAMLTHKNLSSNVQALHQVWQWEPGDVLLHALPIFHAHGLFVGCHLALLNGSPMIFLAKFDLDLVLENLPKATVFMGVPTFYTRLLGDPRFTPELAQGMRLFISGSAPLQAETFTEFEQRTGKRILERYGMTEAIMITSNPYENDARVAGTVGMALPGVSVRVVDDEGQMLPAGEVGNLEITGPNVFKGYWKMPEKTAEEFTDDGYFRTGDLATRSEDGRVTIVGRSKDLIISGGYNVYPKEIEAVIDDLAGVKESAVIGVPHNDFGEAVVAIVVRGPDGKISEEDIIDALKGKLARFKQPKKTFFMEELPRNTMGKVQKNELRQIHRDLFAG
ncbi:malonate--CoA ligase [Emcibacter nanhaiensis]|uniref:3-methylmercaptopropionyl-CoA ligase n=1 Tax=Emcibacter nanhaiensis TaxID=1505037 RepID=A0A501PIB1_9PROT|nr:malonyl-CoA synthase [Emcibacter nanhaiensis]TPD60179.1 malonyl-CoA synthase [Emcibacter nanhaiensis]